MIGGTHHIRGQNMTKERIEDMREVVLPFVTERLKETNYEGKGESDSKEFAKDFNEILDLAIKALNYRTLKTEQLVECEDCVSRKEIEDMLTNIEIAVYMGEGFDYNEWRDKLEELSSVIPKAKQSEIPVISKFRWIPISEKLPDTEGNYLVSYVEGEVYSSWFDKRLNEFNYFHEMAVAWMPLPEHYKSEE